MEAARVPEDVLATPTEGLDRRDQPAKRVVIIGGGIAGLVAAFELRRQGHEPVVLEAQHRVGGRVSTMPRLRAGAVRGGRRDAHPARPRPDARVLRLFGLELRPFVMGNPKTLVYINGQRMTDGRGGRRTRTGCRSTSPSTSGAGRGRTCGTRPRARSGSATRPSGEDALDGDHRTSTTSIDPRVPGRRGFSEGAIELYGVMSFRESNMNAAVVEQLREIVGRAFEDMQEIAGGMDLLPRRLLRARLKHYVRFGAKVTAHRAGRALGDGALQAASGQRLRERATTRSCAIPFSVLRDIEVLDPGVQPREAEGHPRAQLQRLGQDPVPDAAPVLGVGGRHRRRHDGRPTCRSGASATRRTRDPNDERGTLLASYTWGQDALRWGAMDAEDRIEQALEDVAKIHPAITERVRGRRGPATGTTTRTRAARSRCSSRSSRPGSRASSSQPEGRIHFAGEHTSLYHAWIQGALESGIRAAREIHEAPAVLRAGRRNERRRGPPAHGRPPGGRRPPRHHPRAGGRPGTAQEGLEGRPGARKRVVVIGAGMAGLVAAFELGRQGHDVVLLEAQNRVGGRVYTLRDFAPGLYAEAGAMRIPRAHDLTLEYCALFGLELRPFVMGNPKGLVFIGGERMTLGGGAGLARPAAVLAGSARAGPDRGRHVGGGHRRHPLAPSSARARRPGRRSSPSTTRFACSSSSALAASPTAPSSTTR